MCLSDIKLISVIYTSGFTWIVLSKLAEAHLPECTQAPEPTDLLLNHPSEHPLSSLPAQAPKGASPAPGGSARPQIHIWQGFLQLPAEQLVLHWDRGGTRGFGSARLQKAKPTPACGRSTLTKPQELRNKWIFPGTLRVWIAEESRWEFSLSDLTTGFEWLGRKPSWDCTSLPGIMDPVQTTAGTPLDIRMDTKPGAPAHRAAS